MRYFPEVISTLHCLQKKRFIRFRVYNEKYKTAVLRIELIVSLLKNSNFGQLIDDNLFSYRIHSENMSTQDEVT